MLIKQARLQTIREVIMQGSVLSRVLGLVLGVAVLVVVALTAASILQSALGGIGLLVLALLGAFLFARRLVAPIGDLSRALNLLAEGRTDMVVAHRERQGEIGAIARAVETIRESKAKVDRMIEDDRLSLERRQARME